MKQNDFRKHLSLSVKNYNHLFLVKSFENFCEALRRDFLKIHIYFFMKGWYQYRFLIEVIIWLEVLKIHPFKFGTSTQELIQLITQLKVCLLFS